MRDCVLSSPIQQRVTHHTGLLPNVAGALFIFESRAQGAGSLTNGTTAASLRAAVEKNTCKAPLYAQAEPNRARFAHFLYPRHSK